MKALSAVLVLAFFMASGVYFGCDYSYKRGVAHGKMLGVEFAEKTVIAVKNGQDTTHIMIDFVLAK